MAVLEQYIRFPTSNFLNQNNLIEGFTNSFDFEQISCSIDKELNIVAQKNTFTFTLKKDLFTEKKSVIIICSKDNPNILRHSLQKIKDFEIDIDHDILLVDDRSSDNSILNLSDQFKTSYIRIDNKNDVFNYSILNNIAACYAKTNNKDLLIFYNNDMWPEKKESFQNILDKHKKFNADITGCRLLYPSKEEYEEIGKPQHLLNNYLDRIYYTIQHGGINFITKPSSFIDSRRSYISNNLVLAPTHTWRFYSNDTFMPCTDNYCYAVTGAFHIINSKTFFELNGFDIGMGTSFQDIDICLRAFVSNKKILYVGSEYMIHAESLTNAKENISLTKEFSSDNILWDLCWGISLPNILGYQYNGSNNNSKV